MSDQNAKRLSITPLRTRSLAAHPFEAELWQAVIEELNLSAREAEIVELKLRGAAIKEIEKLMGIDRSTIRTFEDRIFAKLGIRRHEFEAHMIRVSHEVRNS